MRRASAVLLFVLLLGGASAAPAHASDVDFKLCEFVGNVAPPAEDDCWGTTQFIGDTYDRQADNVFYVFCTVFPGHPACRA